jgi:Retrotransposon gag protein
MESKDSPTLSSWALFKEELHTYFRDPDEVMTQERKLHMLRMNNNHHVLHYINQFKEVASLTKWNDNALHSQFYQGLPNHLQDDISQEGKPAKLQGMYQAMLKFDGRYRECQEELKAMRTSDCVAQTNSPCGANHPCPPQPPHPQQTPHMIPRSTSQLEGSLTRR